MKAAAETWGAVSAVHAGTGRVSVLSAGSREQLRDIIQEAGKRGDALLPVGKGTNLVGSDRELPLQCLLLTGEFQQTAVHDGCLVTAGSGVPLTALLRQCADVGLGGLSPLVGIPGTLGGALAGNAGAHGRSIFEFAVSVEGIWLTDGSPWMWHEGEGGWGYRCSPVPRNVALTGVTLRFARCGAEEERALQGDILARRHRVTPPGPSLGSTFRNPEDAPPAGKLLEEAGCKGLSCGVFAVSPHHANWIVNAGGCIGAAADYRRLVARMGRRVAERFGICLRAEVRFADELLP